MKTKVLFLSIIWGFSLHAQLVINPIRSYDFALDSVQIAQIDRLVEQKKITISSKYHRSFRRMLREGSFVKYTIPYADPHHNSACFHLSADGNLSLLTKDLLDELLLAEIDAGHPHFRLEDLAEHYAFLMDATYIIRDSSDFTYFLLETRPKIQTLLDNIKLKEKQNKGRIKQCLAFNRIKREVYRYTFYLDPQGHWTEVPRQEVVLKEVGPLIYYR